MLPPLTQGFQSTSGKRCLDLARAKELIAHGQRLFNSVFLGVGDNNGPSTICHKEYTSVAVPAAGWFIASRKNQLTGLIQQHDVGATKRTWE